jgi:hypothetical protein
MGPENQGDYPHGNGKLNIYAYLVHPLVENPENRVSYARVIGG